MNMNQIKFTNGKYWNEDQTQYIPEDVQDYANKYNITLKPVKDGLKIVDYKHFTDYIEFMNYLIYDSIDFKQVEGKVTIIFRDYEEEFY